MIAKRIIPCLDVRGGRVVKGTNFINIADAGDPIECAKEYDRQGADEIVFLDIAATEEGRKTICDIVAKTAEQITVPLTVGGGISSLADIKAVLGAGADKISINSAAVKNPNLLREGADTFGSERIILAADVKRMPFGRYNIFINGGKTDTGLDAIDWIRKAEKLGVGQVLLTSMDADGTKQGFDLAITRAVSEICGIPVIASGGGGTLEHFAEVLTVGKADAALAASLFHFKQTTVGEIKSFLKKYGIPVR
ncbi:MAG: imidazole glycerol phosphate synthase subunit HisF [Clostridia bacterium]